MAQKRGRRRRDRKRAQRLRRWRDVLIHFPMHVHLFRLPILPPPFTAEQQAFDRIRTYQRGAP